MFPFGLDTQWNTTELYLRALKEIRKAEKVECCPSRIWVKRYLHWYYSHGNATEQNPHYAGYMGEMLAHNEDVPSKGRVGHIGRQWLSSLIVLAQCSSHLQGIWWVPGISSCSVWGVATTVKSSSPSAWSGTRVSHPCSEEETGKKQVKAEPQLFLLFLG